MYKCNRRNWNWMHKIAAGPLGVRFRINKWRARFRCWGCDTVHCGREFVPLLRIFWYISNNMQLCTLYLSLQTALHVSSGISNHHQEHTQLYLQHLALAKLLLLPAVIMKSWNCSSNSSTTAAGSSNVLTSTRCCTYSCVRLMMGGDTNRNI